jgi:hypothetical protein
MCLDLSCTLGAQSGLWVAIKKSGQQIARSRRDNLWAREVQWFRQDLAVHFIGVFVVEWWKTRKHFIQKNTKSPPVDGFGVAIATEEFWSQILWCSTEGCTLSELYQLEFFHLLFVLSSSLMSSLQSPKSQRAI